jgi:hypothetical protein
MEYRESVARGDAAISSTLCGNTIASACNAMTQHQQLQVRCDLSGDNAEFALINCAMRHSIELAV